ncbi:anti-anti-sigma factor family protein [Heliomicrobium modesticaldum Ice1]|uniref:Anti-anti-sigma factor family protein n=1 Tax=Heliobacterium modesticaldum (strain ATCC 51547 / Ice1) TaxID=498761 RepID=B0TGR1_HELMI|nr:STAS domain-containing protein [Heliomicrobium modesticaldum]ABZ84672.1 anti-anti-sigma factor family protein [Heliomicrobium modesticaldum Ice1]
MHYIEHEGQQVRVRLEGSFTFSTANKLKDDILKLIDEGRHFVTIDMSGVDLIDSLALGSLVAVLKRTHGYGGNVRLQKPQEFVREVLTITKLNQLFVID